MSTPRRKRRHVPRTFDITPDSREWHWALSNTEYATRLASVVVEFEHLETAMPMVLRRLLGTTRTDVAGYIYRTLRNPSIKFDILQTLLEKSASNAGLGDDYDRIISQYDEVRKGRNAYAHGLWYTATDGSVLLCKRNEHDLAFLDAKPEPIAALDDLLSKIRALTKLIFDTARLSADEVQLLNNPPRSA